MIAIMAIVHIQSVHRHPPPLNRKLVRENPYATRLLRKAIDTAAFKIYGHWVKRGENQNRAALFENAPKCDTTIASMLQENVDYGFAITDSDSFLT